MNPATYTDLAPLDLFKLCCFREAEGEPLLGKQAQAWSVMNRVNHPSWWGSDLVNVLLKPFQYSCFNIGNPREKVWPRDQDPAFLQCVQAVEEAYGGTTRDLTFGAQYYHDVSIDEPEDWVNAGYILTLSTGRFRFYRQPQA